MTADPGRDLDSGGSELLPSRALAALLGLLLVVGGLGTVRALDQPADPGGAPGPKSGPFQPTGFVRVVDGDSLEVLIDGRRVAVAILGIEAAPYGTPCGEAARAEVQSMLGRGVTLEDDPANVLDARKRRVYEVTAPDGRSVAAALVQAGLARANGLGPEAATLSALESQARQAKTGCLWGGAVPAARPSNIVSAGQAGVRAAASVLNNFSDDIIVSGLSFPTGFAILPDGRALVTEKAGKVRMVSGGTLQPTPVVDITPKVNSYWDRGILGIVIDPGFNSNGFFYLFYTYENDATKTTGPKTAQIARFTLQGNGTADPNGAVILGAVTGAGCPDPSTLADCIPSEGASHGGGSMRFGQDGSLYVSTGDAASFTAVDVLALRAQDVNSLAGKILRISSNGQGVSGNPFSDGNLSHSRSKVWARGFRNPFRITLRPGVSLPYVGDVGWSTWEEVDVVPAGTNGGWPCYEGNHVQDGYKTFPVCADLYDDNPSTVRVPLTEWNHGGGGGAALAGTFYTGAVFPPTYQGAFFYADYANGWIKTVTVDGNNQLASAPTQFAGAINGTVQIETGPDGALWYVAIGTGELRKISFVGNYTPIQCPNGQFRAEYYQNTQSHSGSPYLQQCETTIDYNWGGGPPVPGIGDDNFSVRWTGRFAFGNDTYDFTAKSDDGARIFLDGVLILNDWASDGAAKTVTVSQPVTAGEHTVTAEFFDDCCTAEIRVNWQPQHANGPPTPTIASPAVGAKFKVGDVIQLQGSATDPQDGQLTGNSLRWDVIQKHCPGFGAACHDHPLLTVNGPTGQFTAPDHGDGSYFEVRFTATDSRGLASTVSRQVDPKTLQVTLGTSPGGGTVVYDGTSHVAPYAATTIAGSTHSISVQPAAGQQFVSWSQGGPQVQNATVGEQNVTYTASLMACTPRPQVVLNTAPAGNGRRQVTVSTTPVPGYPTNAIRFIQFTSTQLAVLEVPGHATSPAPFTMNYPDGTTQTSFVIQRTGAGSLLTKFVVYDSCGAWPTFVGAGPSAGW